MHGIGQAEAVGTCGQLSGIICIASPLGGIAIISSAVRLKMGPSRSMSLCQADGMIATVRPGPYVVPAANQSFCRNALTR